MQLATVALAVAACSQDDLEVPGGTTSGDEPIAITITDGGYANAATRAVEDGYRTEFTPGDACGLYIVRDGNIVGSNLKLTAEKAAGEAATGTALAWKVQDGVGNIVPLYYAPDSKYFIYYPYQQDAAMAGKTADAATLDESSTDAGFFQPLIAGWQPKADQSDYQNGYTASDLMTATSTVSDKDAVTGKRSLSFSMTHRMAMAVIELPKTEYELTDFEGNKIPNYIVAPSADFDENKPYSPMPGIYRYIVNPDQTSEQAAPTLIGSYDDSKKEFTITPTGITANKYKTYKVDGAMTEKKTHQLQVGDFFFADGHLLSKDVVPSEVQAAKVIGIVFALSRIGQAEKDALKTKGINEPHGLVMSVKNAGTDLMWSSEFNDFGDLENCKSKEQCNADISGLWNYNAVIAYAKGENKLSSYPAFEAIDKWNAENSEHKAPENTTGWYLPAVGQWYDFFHNLGDLPDWGSASVSDDNYYWSGQSESVLSNVNTFFSPLGDGNYDAFGYQRFWSSSEFSNNYARDWAVYSGADVYCYWFDKRRSYDVRPVLAF